MPTMPFRATRPSLSGRRPVPMPVLLALAFLVLPALLLSGCGAGDPAESAADAPAAETAPAAADGGEASDTGVRRYEVRGEIAAVPDPDDPLSNLVIRHEAIDDFESYEGEVVGMSSMSMPFPVAEAVSLEGVEVGDKVEFTLAVDWEGDPAYQVVRMEELPADTELEYRKAKPPEELPEAVVPEAVEEAASAESR